MPFDPPSDDERPAPPPSDRLWRHPSELGGSAPASTDSPPLSSGRRLALPIAATAAVLVGAFLILGASVVPKSGGSTDERIGGRSDTRLAVATTVSLHDEPGAHLGVRVIDAPDGSGAEVIGLVDSGPAADSGIRIGDVVTTFDGTPIEHADGLVAEIARCTRGDTVTVGVERNGHIPIRVVLD